MTTKFRDTHRYGKPLSDMQRTVLDLYKQGLDGTHIAAQLGVSRRTVETHVQGARLRMGANKLPDQLALYTAVVDRQSLHWTPTEDQHLRDHRDNDPELIATVLNRSVGSVQLRLKELFPPE